MKVFIAITAVAALCFATADAVPPKVPAKLYRVNGRPVPVSCLEQLAAQDNMAARAPIDLRTCGNPHRKPKIQPDGSIGYDIPDGGYFYYSYVGRIGGVDVLSLQNSGGGTGHFTQLVGVVPHGESLHWARDYGGGDRCNGGVSGERIANGKLLFDQAISPYDLIKLGRPTARLEAYKDLEASAASCIGVVHRVDDDAHWTGVDLDDPDWEDRPGWTDDYRYQACFNKLYRAAVRKSGVELNRDGVQAFTKRFFATCVRES